MNPGKPTRTLPKRKCPTTGRRVLDKDKVKAEYLAQGQFNFRHFLRDSGYPYGPSIVELFPHRRYQREWLAMRRHDQNLDLVPDTLQLRGDLAKARLEFIRNWNVDAKNLHQYFRYVLQQRAEAIQHDQQNRSLIVAGKTKPRFDYGAEDLAILAAAAEKIQNIHARTVGVQTAFAIPEILALTQADMELPNQPEDEAPQPIQEVEPFQIKDAPQDPEALKQMLAQWYDDAKLLPSPEEPGLTGSEEG